MIKVGFYLELKNNSNMDFRTVTKSNPGVGGTEYLVVLLATLLAEKCENYSVTIYTNNNQMFSDKIKQRIVESEYNAIEAAAKDKMEVFIFTVRNWHNDFYKMLDKYGINSIAWVHNYINYKVLDNLYHAKFVKRIIFVSRQHYDAYIDDKIISKSSYIYNIVTQNPHFVREKITEDKVVTYIGALHKSKGFDLLARQWKEVLKVIPDAKLYVIGSGKLYDRTAQLGDYGLATKSFEKKFIPYIIDENGDILESVKFLGTLGIEKEEIYKKTTVGVANPSGKTETFCLSAVEFEARGIPVVSYKGYGLLDTVVHEKSGLLSNKNSELAKNLILLLKDEDLNVKFGNTGIEYSKLSFSPSILLPQWDNVINEVIDEISPVIMFSHSHYSDDWKWLKYLNYKFKHVTKLQRLPSVAYVVSFFKQSIKSLISSR